jgi:NADH-quinone oxidoreductase subunit G
MAKVKFFIDGYQLEGNDTDTVLNIARANDIFIPAICYLNRCSPTLACRICLVEADGKQVFACNAKPKEGMQIVTNSEEIKTERKAIMQAYDINHPLECGVCDKSGECELQNYTMEVGVDTQEYSVPDCARPIKKWGPIKYDSSLCIVCERCTTVCKDMVGDNALGTTPRGGAEIDKAYKETMPKNAFTIWTRMQKNIIGTKSGNPDVLDCTLCGECIAVCPVGALTSSDFTYKSNAWELKQIPSSCAHCSSACHLYYEVKHTSIDNAEEKIYRVRNEWNFQSLCGAGRFGFDYDNTASKDQKAFEKAITALKSASYIKFNSFITNEEALILQKIKEKTGIRLVNKDAYEYKKFIEAYSSISGKSLYSGSLKETHGSNFVVTVGTMIKNDNPVLRFAVNNAVTMNKGAAVYMHPINDTVISGLSKNMLQLNYKPLSEEKTILALMDAFADKDKLPSEIVQKLKTYETTYVKTVTEKVKEKIKEIVKEKVTAEDGTESEIEKEVEKEIEKSVSKEVEVLSSKLFTEIGLALEDKEKMTTLKKDKATLILGQDLYSHPRAENIAKLAALFEKASGFKVVIIPSQTNTLGVSMICDIDKEGEGFSVGYNEEGDFILTSFGSKQRDNALDMPALNQQEGTFVSIDKRVVPLNAAIEFKGYELNDLANAIGINKEFTIDYTKELPVSKGFKSISFDDLPNKFLNDGTEDRGYILDTKDTETSTSIEDVAELEEMNGGVVYAGSTVNGFSEATSICKQLAYEPDALYVGKGAMEKYALEENETVTIKLGSQSAKYKVVHEGKISSDIVIAASFEPNNPMFETLRDGYAFKRIEIIKG